MFALETSEDHSIEGLRLARRPEPQLRNGHAVVQLHAVSLNYRDLLVVRGEGRWRPPPGRIPGSDGCGTIVALASDVTDLKVGERVMPAFLPQWRDGPLTAQKLTGSLGGSAADGVLAEYALVPAASLVRVPAPYTSAEAATFPCAALTAWHALERAAALRSGRRVLLQGTGGVSIFALQFLVGAGAQVVITSSSDEKLAKAASLGAQAGVNYRSSADWVAEAMSASDGLGFDVVIDVGGASTLRQSVQLAAYEGVVSVVGLIGGLEATLDLTPVFAKNLRIDGIEVGSRAMLVDMVDWMAQRQIRPMIDRVFPFSAVRDALRYLESGAHFGKVVVDLSQAAGSTLDP